MLNETFYLDGIDARSAGIQLQEPIEFSEAVPVVEAQTIPGRNGDLIWETGSYENRSGSASCFCLQKDVEKAVSSAGRFLMGKKGYRRLETSDDPNHYWMARVENSPQIAMRLRTLAPFEIGFDCKPQRFLKSGDIPIRYSVVDPVSGLNASIFNFYGFDAKPLILLKASNKQEPVSGGFLRINDRQCLIREFYDYLYLDCDLQNAYNESGNMNSFVICEEFPILESGENEIFWFGLNVEEVEIVPRWWEL